MVARGRLAVAMFLAAAAAGAVWARKRGISISGLLKTASPTGLLEAGALTLLYWGIVFVEVWLFCKASGFDARILHMALVVPPALLSSMIPISFSGFGVRELAMVVLLKGAPVGMSYEQGLVVSLMYDIIGLGIPILMGILFWLSKRQDGAPQA